MHLCRRINRWSLRCSWSIAWRRCSNYIFIPNLTHGFNSLGKDSCKTRQETFKFWDSVRLILEIWRYMFNWLWPDGVIWHHRTWSKLPAQCQAITWTNIDLLSIRPSGTIYDEIGIKILNFSFPKIHLKNVLKMVDILFKPESVSVLKLLTFYMLNFSEGT